MFARFLRVQCGVRLWWMGTLFIFVWKWCTDKDREVISAQQCRNLVTFNTNQSYYSIISPTYFFSVGEVRLYSTLKLAKWGEINAINFSLKSRNIGVVFLRLSVHNFSHRRAGGGWKMMEKNVTAPQIISDLPFRRGGGRSVKYSKTTNYL